MTYIRGLTVYQNIHVIFGGCHSSHNEWISLTTALFVQWRLGRKSIYKPAYFVALKFFLLKHVCSFCLTAFAFFLSLTRCNEIARMKVVFCRRILWLLYCLASHSTPIYKAWYATYMLICWCMWTVNVFIIEWCLVQMNRLLETPFTSCQLNKVHTVGLVAMELLQSCTKPLIYKPHLRGCFKFARPSIAVFSACCTNLQLAFLYEILFLLPLPVEFYLLPVVYLNS